MSRYLGSKMRKKSNGVFQGGSLSTSRDNFWNKPLKKTDQGFVARGSELSDQVYEPGTCDKAFVSKNTGSSKVYLILFYHLFHVCLSVASELDVLADEISNGFHEFRQGDINAAVCQDMLFDTVVVGTKEAALSAGSVGGTRILVCGQGGGSLDVLHGKFIGVHEACANERPFHLGQLVTVLMPVRVPNRAESDILIPEASVEATFMTCTSRRSLALLGAAAPPQKCVYFAIEPADRTFAAFHTSISAPRLKFCPYLAAIPLNHLEASSMLCTSYVSPIAILVPERCLVPYSRFAFVRGSTCPHLSSPSRDFERAAHADADARMPSDNILLPKLLGQHNRHAHQVRPSRAFGCESHVRKRQKQPTIYLQLVSHSDMW
ncbi:hypothetical protein KCU61_g543, partial [Aureobasidium melanogenum]